MLQKTDVHMFFDSFMISYFFPPTSRAVICVDLQQVSVLISTRELNTGEESRSELHSAM